MTTPPAQTAPLPPKDAVVYEIHVRDFTIEEKSGVAARGKYLGFAETGATLAGSPDIRTGLDHLKELGVNVVQLLPVQNFAQPNDAEGFYEAFGVFSPYDIRRQVTGDYQSPRHYGIDVRYQFGD